MAIALRPLLRSALVLLCLLLVKALGGAELDAQFARAERDPAAVAPLVVAASARIPQLPAPQALALAERLAPFSRRVFLSAERLPGDDVVGVRAAAPRKAESLAALARRVSVPRDWLARLNPQGLKADTPAKTLAPAPLSVVLSRSTCRLLVWRGAHFVTVMPCAVGSPGRDTPLGRTTVRVRAQDPEWRDPDTGKLHPPRSPGNTIGGYWIGFEPRADRAFAGIGIHGWTADPVESWIGKPVSHGCIRLRQDDLKTVFAVVSVGTVIEVRE